MVSMGREATYLDVLPACRRLLDRETTRRGQFVAKEENRAGGCGIVEKLFESV